jgi:hypothetical protein
LTEGISGEIGLALGKSHRSRFRLVCSVPKLSAIHNHTGTKLFAATSSKFGCGGQLERYPETCADPTGKKAGRRCCANGQVQIELQGTKNYAATNLQACIGECNADSQCAAGLTCFQRRYGAQIPGCKGNGGGRDWDYCSEKNWCSYGTPSVPCTMYTFAEAKTSCENAGARLCSVAEVEKSAVTGKFLY